MRKTFYERLAERDFDVPAEYDRLMYLFDREKCVGVSGYYNTVSKYVDTYYFRELPFRGSSTNLEDLMTEINLPALSYEIDDLYLLCEFLVAVLPLEQVMKDRDLRVQAKTIISNINYILEKTGHELREDPSGNQIIVAKNNAAILAMEMIEDENVAFDLIEYNHYALKGDLEGKKKLLSSIGMYIEPLLKDRTFKESMYKKLVSDASFLLNNFHIRHNNKTGQKEQAYIKSLNDNELEQWYDKTYELMVAVIIANTCLSTQKDIDELKQTYQWKV